MSNNKEKGNASYFIKIAGSLFIIASVMALLLAVFNSITKDKIEENNRKEIEATIKDIFSDYGDSIKNTGIEFDAPDDSDVDELYKVTVDGTVIGYVAICSPQGFKAEIKLAVGMNIDGDCRSVKVISLSETPGVGAKVAEAAFLDNFKSEKGELTLVKDGGTGTIDAIAGATISSRAVTKGVSDALTLTQKVIGGEAK